MCRWRLVMLRVALRVAAALEVEWPALARDSIVASSRGARDQLRSAPSSAPSGSVGDRESCPESRVTAELKASRCSRSAAASAGRSTTTRSGVRSTRPRWSLFCSSSELDGCSS